MEQQPVSLTNEYVVDAHSHGFRLSDLLGRPPGEMLDRITMLGACLISSGGLDPDDLPFLRELTDSDPLSMVCRMRLSELLECEPTREAVSEARREALSADGTAYLRRLWGHAGIRGLMVDDGYPLPRVDPVEMAQEADIPVHRVVRIEPLIADIRERVASYAELEDALAAELESACTSGQAVAIKSVIAYRTGLDVTEWRRDDVTSSYLRWAEAGFPETRELAKPVRDALLWRTLDVAKRLGRPVHIHCGGGDPSVVLAHARPKDLFPLLDRHRDQPIVLIHSGWPWLEEGAYVASILPRVYLETSINTAWSSLIMDQKLEAIMGIAPTAKIMFGSDESTEPELAWISAITTREALERVLSNAVRRRWMTVEDAVRVGRGVLAKNCERLHGLDT
jgi:predicted TIM-barrel fold metal-dependent hydrolase